MTKLQEKVAAKKARPSRSKAAVAARAVEAAKNAETLTKQIAEAQVQLDKLNAVATMDTVAKREAHKPPVLTPFTQAENVQFKARIDNEKSNIWRQCNAQPQAIIDHINANKADESNAAIRFARRDALAWAQRSLQPVDAPFWGVSPLHGSQSLTGAHEMTNSDPREWNTDTIMIEYYEELQNQVSDRKQVSLELQHERDHNLLLQEEVKLLKKHIGRVENERDYYQLASAFQGIWVMKHARKSQSVYLGVYDSDKTEKPYRVAIRRFINNKPHYTNVGYFITEETAAWVYNVYALCAFGVGAIINDVEVTDQIEDEIEEYASNRGGFYTMMTEATRVTETHGDKIRINQHG
jgi:hypothetical protein